MTKRQLIDEIMEINKSAEPEFLARFSDEQLSEYLEHLHVLRTPRLSGDPGRYNVYFENLPKPRTRPTAPAGDDGQEADEVEALAALPQPEQQAGQAPPAPQAEDNDQQQPFASQQGSDHWLF